MAMLVSLFGYLGQQAGRFVSMALGWASTLLFGRVPQDRQLILSIVTLGSLLWVVLIVGVVLPDIGAILIAAAPAPPFIDRAWIRIAMLVGALLTPIAIGAGSLLLQEPQERPHGFGLVRHVLRGYPLAVVLAVILVFLAVVGVARKVRTLSRRWTDLHVPLVVQPGRYEAVVDEIAVALRNAGLPVAEHPAPSLLALPAHLVARVAGGGVRSLVPDRLMVLATPSLEVELYPSDIAVAGTRGDVARARAAIMSRLTTADAHLTNSRESEAIEDRIRAVAGLSTSTGAAGLVEPSLSAAGELASIDRALAEQPIPGDEWDVLYRMRLQVERDLRAGQPVGETFSVAPAARARSKDEALPGRLATQIGAAVLVILATADLGLAAFERVRRQD